MDTCDTCGGKGMLQRMQQMGPMITMSTGPCISCAGKGQKIGEKCSECNSNCVVSRESSLEVIVEPGMQDGDRIIFSGACSESPEFEAPGDVVLVVRAAAEPESPWLRKAAVLAVEVQLSWAEAMLGWSRTWSDHPSGRILKIVWTDGPIRDGEVLRVPDWGMPVRNGNGAVGCLQIICRINGVQIGWTPEQTSALRTIWPEWSPPVNDGQEWIIPQRNTEA